MPLEIVTVPCLSDNYAYLVKGPEGAILIDAPEAAPIEAALDARGWGLDAILITHHHHDHVGAIPALRARYRCSVIGPRTEADKIGGLDQLVGGGDEVSVAGVGVHVIDVPGHTLGHIAFYMPQAGDTGAAFTADSLMALGCGRLFEGDAEMMWASMQRLMALPAATMIFSGHEYTSANARFALTIEPGNAELKSRSDVIAKARTEGRATASCALSEELATNPFLRPDSPEIRERLGLTEATNAVVFAEIRARKDSF